MKQEAEFDYRNFRFGIIEPEKEQITACALMHLKEFMEESLKGVITWELGDLQDVKKRSLNLCRREKRRMKYQKS